MIYVIYSAPWGSGHKPFQEKDEKKIMSFLNDLKKNHSREKGWWSPATGKWRGRTNIKEFNLSVTFKISDLWNQ